MVLKTSYRLCHVCWGIRFAAVRFGRLAVRPRLRLHPPHHLPPQWVHWTSGRVSGKSVDHLSAGDRYRAGDEPLSDALLSKDLATML